MSRVRAVAAALAGALLLVACSGDDGAAAPTPPAATPTESPRSPTDEPEASPTPEPTPEPATDTAPPPAGPVEPTGVEVIATGLDVPWDIAFLPDGDALVSERVTGRILRVTPEGDVSELGTVDGIAAAGEGGLHGIALHDDWLYAYYTAAGDNRVVRMPFDGDSLGSQEVIIDGIPKAGNHNGGRIVFGPDDMLYIATGDAAEPALAQNPDSPAGKILRATPDGDVPGDNPFDGSLVYSLGHRNVQGLTFDADGRLWASEFGPQIEDELNLIEAGQNYGWPEAGGIAGDDRYTDAVAEWEVAAASPSGIAYVDGTLFMAALRGQRLWQIALGDGSAGDMGTFPGGRYVDGIVAQPQEFYAGEFGRLRHVELAPDGSLWVLTNNTDGRNPDGPGPDDDRVLRVTVE